ncbi:hypothetical protein [Sphingopyxis sp. JAI128]|uniref:hypothetical protein n=1 Tax=Sphingopyxis sp. JAI128 TaxID=2723066 RepID=UPI001613B14E|nr:hypothetical protein [Sphingopyxis sp. JAI128]MBB6424985.1 hypothetical protein [Sphingopyxis sp. JAI128]
MTALSPDLIAFLKAWYEWATNGAPQFEPFNRGYGLCGNAAIYGDRRLVSEVVHLFPNRYPFGSGDYHNRFARQSQHECPKRLAWVRERLIEAGEMVA